MIKIVDVEGLDAFGKTTFCKQLVTTLNEMAPEKTRFIYQHFPDYCTETGKEIKDFLFNCKDPFSEKAIRYMIELQMRNRQEWWLRSWEELNAKDYDETVVIADRFTVSNAIYQIPLLQNPEAELEYYRKMEYEKYRTVVPVFNIFCICDKALQEERLRKRGNNDSYEDFKHQDFLREHYLETAVKYVDDKNFMILPLDLLDGEYAHTKYFPKWTGENIAEEMYKILVYDVIKLFNRLVFKKSRIMLKTFKYNRTLKQWCDTHVWVRCYLRTGPDSIKK